MRDKKSNFEELLKIEGFVSIQHQNIRCLAIKMFIVFIFISRQILKEIFPFREMQCLTNKGNRQIFKSYPCIVILGGTENTKFLGPKIWEILPHEIKQLESFNEFKKAIKQWKPTSCPCRLCMVYFYLI